MIKDQQLVHSVWPEWELMEYLGSGSFGIVYKARKHGFAGVSYAAIKIVTIKNEKNINNYSVEQIDNYLSSVTQNYAREIQMMESVKGYSNIVNIEDYSVIKSSGGKPWYVLIRMELLTSLYEYLENKEITNDLVIRIGTDLCKALEVCATANIVHRDIKPENVFVNNNGVFKLGDFGVARQILDYTSQTRIGAQNFMAPEIYNGSLHAVDFSRAQKADIYSLGMLLYWAANGRRMPFIKQDGLCTADEIDDAFIRKMSGEKLPEPINASDSLKQVILKACEYNPEERYESASDMSADLASIKKDQKSEALGSVWKKYLWIFVAVIMLSCIFLFILRPIFFSGWSEWSDWSESRLSIENPEETKEQIQEKFKWQAVQCTVCGEHNPINESTCKKCGSVLSDELGRKKQVFAYTDDNAFQIIYEEDFGKYIDGKPYWYIGRITLYRYSYKNQEDYINETKTHHISLIAPENTEEQAFIEAQETLRKRLEIFTDNHDYNWTDINGKIELYLPADSFAGEEIEYVLKAYLTRPFRLYAINLTNRDEFVEIMHQDIENASLLYGSIDGVNPTDYGIDKSEYYYLKVVLSDEFWKAHYEKLHTWDQFCFAQDIEEFPDDYYIQYTIPSEERTYYIINNDPGLSFSELVLYNMTHDPLPTKLLYSIDVNSLTDWRNPNIEQSYGQNQCNPDEIRSPSVTFSLRYYKSLTEGEKVDTEAILTKRLDAIGSPYALGTRNDEKGGTIYVIKTDLTRMGIPLMLFLCPDSSDDVIIQAGSLSTNRIYMDALNLKVNKDRNCFEISIDQNHYSYEKIMESLRKVAEEALCGDGYLYISISEGFSQDGIPFFAARADAFLEDGILTVTDYCEVQNSKTLIKALDHDSMWLADLFMTLIQTNKAPESFSLYDYQLNEEPDGTKPSEDSFAIKFNMISKDLEDKIHMICPKAELGRTADFQSLFIVLNLEINEQLPEIAPGLVKEIYELLDFSSSYERRVYITLTDEPDNELARFVFTKNTEYDENNELFRKDKITASIILYGERMEHFAEAMLENAKNMDFYQEMNITSGI